MNSRQFMKKKIRREGLRIVGYGFLWFLGACILQMIGVFDWMLRLADVPDHLPPAAFVSRLGLALLIYLVGAPLAIGGPGLILHGLYELLFGSRTRFAKALLGELLTAEEREEHLVITDVPEPPMDSRHADRVCPFCATTSITYKGEQSCCEACGAVWTVTVPKGFWSAVNGVLVSCALAALFFGLAYNELNAIDESGRLTLLSAATFVAVALFFLACLGGAVICIRSAYKMFGVPKTATVNVLQKPAQAASIEDREQTPQ